jgi:four helix bundle protein
MIPLEELKVYKIALEIGDIVWEIVDKWPPFAKQTLGGQSVRSADSIALNIAEGYGRYFYKENRNFCFYSRGSAKEVTSALNKSKKRGLMTEQENSLLQEKLLSYFKLINAYIKSIGSSKGDDDQANTDQ